MHAVMCLSVNAIFTMETSDQIFFFQFTPFFATIHLRRL
jgi:hypothetical protein